MTGIHKQTVSDIIKKYQEQGLEIAIKAQRASHHKKAGSP